MLVVIDSGNYSTKYFFRNKEKTMQMGNFLSVSHDYVPFLESAFSRGTNGIKRIQFYGADFYVGDGCVDLFLSKKDEKMFTGNVRKGHAHSLVRVVASLHEVYKISQENSFDVIITSPIKSCTLDKAYFTEALLGEKAAIVNDTSFAFSIHSVTIAAEGLGATAFVDKKNHIIVDAGSHTTKILRIVQGDMTANSETLNGGTQTKSAAQIAQTVFRSISDVDFEFPIRVTGGKSTDVAQALAATGYTNCESVSANGCEPFYMNGYGVFLLAEEMEKEKLHG